MPQWRIYYDDGTTFDDTQGAPEDAPGLGVVCIVQACPDLGRQIMSGWDFYYFRPSSPVPWWGCEWFGLIDNLTAKPRDTQAVKAGRTIDSLTYEKIRELAGADPDFRRTVAAVHEDRPPQARRAQSQGLT